MSIIATSAFVQNFVVKADDLEQIEELGRGAYGVVDKMKHVPTNVIMAVKVNLQRCCYQLSISPPFGHRSVQFEAFRSSDE